MWMFFFFFQAEGGIRFLTVTGVQTCALPISTRCGGPRRGVRHPPLHAPPRQIESRSRGAAAAEEGCDDCQPVRHRIYLRQRFAWEAERVEPQTAPSAFSRQLFTRWPMAAG